MSSVSSLQFRFVPGERFITPHRVEAIEDGQPVGHLDWHMKTGHVLKVEVNEEHRRQGVATGLWQQAQTAASGTRSVVKPKHSSERTVEGDAWAKSVGGPVPRRSNS